jgi:AcrR family transcriptional regulator
VSVPSGLAVRPDARSAIVDAAAHLLRQGGAPAVTTRAVAEAAGVPAPTIFRIFGDKSGLLDAVAEHVMATYAAAKVLQVAEEDGDPVAELRAAWLGHIDFGLTNPDLFALLASPGRSHSPATALGADVLATRVARLAAAGLLRVSTARAVSMIHAAGTGVVLALLGQPEDARDAGLAQASFDAVLGGILAPVPAPRTADLAALTVTFEAAVPGLPNLSEGERTLLLEWLRRVTAELQT